MNPDTLKTKTEFLDNDGHRIPFDASADAPDVYNLEVFKCVGSSKVYFIDDTRVEEPFPRFFFQRTGGYRETE